MNRASRDAEIDARTVAWILYAIAMTSGSTPAPLTDITTAADAINHAVPTQHEMQGSLRRLQALGLVQAHGRSFGLTGAGEVMLKSAQGAAETVSKVWANLTLAIGQLHDTA